MSKINSDNKGGAVQGAGGALQKTKFDITGMTCSSCSAHVTKAVEGLAGAAAVNVNLLANSMTVEHEGALTADAIIRAVDGAGYGAAVHGAAAKAGEPKPDTVKLELASMKRRLIVSFAFMLPLFYLSMGHMAGWPLPSVFLGVENALVFAFTQFLLCLPIIIVNEKYFRVGFKTLWRRSPNMDSLIAIGSSAAVVYGIYAIYKIGWGLGHGDMHLAHSFMMDIYFETAAMILALITLGKYLEARSKGKTSEAITKLVNLAPKTALVLRGGAEEEIPLAEVLSGDTVIVKAGQTVPVDGVVLEGSGAVDESALTGESIPVEKRAGDKVTGASINKAGYFTFRATRVGEDTALAQIIRLVEEASASKAPIAQLADKVSAVFVPVVIAVALLAAGVWLLLGAGAEFAISIGIAVLVISCPCALGLATPTAIMVGTGKGAENGILIKSAEALETLHSIDTVVLDKTGTVTEGKPRVTDIVPANGVTEDELLQAAAAMEKSSEHPLAEAIIQAAEERGLVPEKAAEFEALEGRGLRAVLNGVEYFAGNRKLMEERGAQAGDFYAKADTLAEDGKTPLYFARGGKLMGLVAVADVIKPTSGMAVRQFAAMGIDVVMLTGDNAKTADAIRRQAGIANVIAEVLPQDKEREVRRLQQAGKKVAMIGDGINDAPALARADVGVAIGAGTDVAIESADIVLMKSDLLDAVSAVQLSKAVIRNIKQNLFWALLYNTIGIPLAAGVFYSLLGWKLNPMFGAAAMSLSSVCVVTNALRLKLFKPKFTAQGGAAASIGATSIGAANIGTASIETANTGTADIGTANIETANTGAASIEAASTETANTGTAYIETANVSTANIGTADIGTTNIETANTITADTKTSNTAVNTIIINESEEKKMITKTIRVDGMMCAHCKATVEKALGAVEGVSGAEVDLDAKTVAVTAQESVTSAALAEAITAAGYTVVSAGE